MSWEGVQLSCSLTCSRMYCWQKQQGRSRVSPEHSQPHERMMVDYLHEMSYAGPPESQDSTLATLLRMTQKGSWRHSIFVLVIDLTFFFFQFSLFLSSCMHSRTDTNLIKSLHDFIFAWFLYNFLNKSGSVHKPSTSIKVFKKIEKL